jgi:hypothetical protein
MADLSDFLEKGVSVVGGAPLALPLAAITAPTGGATTDAEARAAINLVITRLEALGLVVAN